MVRATRSTANRSGCLDILRAVGLVARGLGFAGTITLLFRLLFLLYAESRDLLPVHDQLGYRKKSLQALKERVHDDLRIGAKQSAQSFDYWEHLCRLFRIVDRGDAALSVPPYNGGLFHAPKKAPSKGAATDADAGM